MTTDIPVTDFTDFTNPPPISTTDAPDDDDADDDDDDTDDDDDDDDSDDDDDDPDGDRPGLLHKLRGTCGVVAAYGTHLYSQFPEGPVHGNVSVTILLAEIQIVGITST